MPGGAGREPRWLVKSEDCEAKKKCEAGSVRVGVVAVAANNQKRLPEFCFRMGS